MTLRFVTDLSAEEMDRFVIESAQNSLYQCSTWADVKSNWKSVRTGIYEDDKLVGTALVLIRPLAAGMTLAYVPRGPVMNYHNREHVVFFLDSLKKLARRNRAIVLRFDPSIYSRKYQYSEKDSDNPYLNQDVIDLLKEYGAEHKGFTKRIEEATQPRYNASMDVDEHWRDRLIKNTRQSIRTAEKRGVEVLEGHEYLHLFAEAMHYTETRQKVALRNEDYFRNMLQAYGDHARIMVAVLNFAHQKERLEADLAQAQSLLEKAASKKEINALNLRIRNDKSDLERNQKDWDEEGKDEVVLCGKLVCFNDRRMEFFYMGNNTKYMRVRANYYLYSLFLDMCAEMHIPYCSFGGIEGTLDDGLTQFKSAWPINIEEYIGEFNIVLNPFMYGLFDRVYPKLLKLAAKIRGNS